jgi:hypothetical protein
MNDMISVRKISTLHDLRKVYKLAHDVYCLSGIANPSADGLMIHHPGQDVVPQTHIFVAEEDNRMIGTISLSIDNQFGLMVDSGFKPIIDQYRSQYRAVGSIWRFAVLPQYQSNLNVMRKLIGITSLCLIWYKVDVSFITLSPDHVSFYKRVMMLDVVAEGTDPNPLIKPDCASVVLMKLHTEKLPKKWIAKPESEVFVQ